MIANTIAKVRAVKEAQERPASFVTDLLLGAVVSMVIPIPFVPDVLVKHKQEILFGLAGVIVFAFVLISLIITVVSSPFTFFFAQPASISADQIAALQNYIEDGFSDTDIPQKNPFGGAGFVNTITTVNFGEQENIVWNFQSISLTEQGIDLVPSDTYFSTNKAAKLTGEPILFATITGTAVSYTDANGALIIEIKNAENTIKTVFIHLQQVLVTQNQTVHAGAPIAVMGSTGMSTGPHLEYQVRLNEQGSWAAVDPVNYIQ